MNDLNKKDYKKYTEKHAPRSPMLKNCIWAFTVGGLICVIGQALSDIYMKWGMSKETAGTVTSVTLIFFAVLLTGIGIFDDIAKRAGAGTLVPITGFANAVASPAIDTKTEGFILGVGAKIFTIAGPVILYGISAGVVYGVIYWITTLF